MTDETLLGIATIVGAVMSVQGLFAYGIVKILVTGRPLLKWYAETDAEEPTSASTSETKPIHFHRP